MSTLEELLGQISNTAIDVNEDGTLTEEAALCIEAELVKNGYTWLLVDRRHNVMSDRSIRLVVRLRSVGTEMGFVPGREE